MNERHRFHVTLPSPGLDQVEGRRSVENRMRSTLQAYMVFNDPPFRNFDAATFLDEHWQKTPQLIRNPWQAWANPLSPKTSTLTCLRN